MNNIFSRVQDPLERKPRSQRQRDAYARNSNLLNRIIPAQRLLQQCNILFLTQEERTQVSEAMNLLNQIKEKYRENNFEFGIKTSITFYSKEEYQKYIKSI